jgi:hypothetical protein
MKRRRGLKGAKEVQHIHSFNLFGAKVQIVVQDAAPHATCSPVSKEGVVRPHMHAPTHARAPGQHAATNAT